MQIVVDDVNLDNGTTRRMLGQIKNITLGNNQSVVCKFIVQGDTVDEFNDNWAAAQAAFNKKNPRVLLYADDTATKPTEEISWLDGHHSEVQTTISWDPEYTQTGYSAVCTFTLNASTTFPAGGSGGNANQFQGQQGSIKLIKVYSTGNIKSRIVEAIFQATFEKRKFGPFTVSAVETNSGSTRFVLTGTLPAFKAGQKIEVSGTVNYNGIFQVTDITGQKVTVTKPFGSAETPGAATAYIGQATTGEENLTAAMSSLMTDYLLTSATGGLDVGAGKIYTFSGKTIRALDKEGTSILATLSSAEMLIDISSQLPSARQFEIVVGVQHPEAYDAKGGAEPILYTGKGKVIVDREVLGSTNVSGVFAAVETQIKTEVATQGGLAPTALKPLTLSLALSRDGMWVNFEISYVSVSVGALKYGVTTQENTTQPILSHRDSDGYHILQIPPGPPDGSVVKTVHRTGFGLLNLGFAVAPPVQSGFTFIEASRTKLKESPKDTPFGGEQIYEETWAITFNRYRLRKGGGAVSGAQGSGGAFDGSGYFTPTGPDV